MNLLSELQAAISQGADLDVKDEFETTPLLYAISKKNVEAVARLLEGGAKVDIQDADGKTALHYAIEFNLPDIARNLLERDSKLVAIGDRFGNEPLWTAAFGAGISGNYELVALLLRYGADPEHRNDVNRSALDLARLRSDDALQRLLEIRPEARGPNRGRHFQ